MNAYTPEELRQLATGALSRTELRLLATAREEYRKVVALQQRIEEAEEELELLRRSSRKPVVLVIRSTGEVELYAGRGAISPTVVHFPKIDPKLWDFVEDRVYGGLPEAARAVMYPDHHPAHLVAMGHPNNCLPF